MVDIVKIIAYEQGELDQEQIVDMFQELVDSGEVWSLQGSYGRAAQALINEGLIQTTQGE